MSTLLETLVASMVLGSAGLALLSSQAEGTRRVARDSSREAVESVMEAVSLRFSSGRGGIEGFLRPAGDATRLAGSQPWRWSPELTAGLEHSLLETWARDRELEIRVELVKDDVPGLYALNMTAGWREPGPDRARRSLRRVRRILADAGR
jgi:type II secretory pathway pseudopilin PulG